MRKKDQELQQLRARLDRMTKELSSTNDRVRGVPGLIRLVV